MRGDARAYYRFRFADFYGGIITADAIGCNLLCAYCWNYERNLNPEGQGKFHSPSEVAQKLKRLGEKHNIDQYRISGCEPILGERSAKHILDIINSIDGNFIIETNGIMLGFQPGLIELLQDFDGLIRIAVKGHNSNVFQKVTGANGEYYNFSLDAFKRLRAKGIDVQIAYMPEFVQGSSLKAPQNLIEEEEMNAFNGTRKRLRERGLY